MTAQQQQQQQTIASSSSASLGSKGMPPSVASHTTTMSSATIKSEGSTPYRCGRCDAYINRNTHFHQCLHCATMCCKRCVSRPSSLIGEGGDNSSTSSSVTSDSRRVCKICAPFDETDDTDVISGSTSTSATSCFGCKATFWRTCVRRTCAGCSNSFCKSCAPHTVEDASARNASPQHLIACCSSCFPAIVARQPLPALLPAAQQCSHHTQVGGGKTVSPYKCAGCSKSFTRNVRRNNCSGCHHSFCSSCAFINRSSSHHQTPVEQSLTVMVMQRSTSSNPTNNSLSSADTR